MNGKNTKLLQRLEKIWDHPDFSEFFATISNSRLIKKGTIIFNEGDPLDRIYFIEKGFVKLFRLSDEGRETTIYLYGPGNILGVRALTSKDECAKHFAEAITDLKISTITRKDYLKVLAENPEYLVDLLHVFINRLNYTERKLEGFIITDATARVAYFLADCVTRFCKVVSNQTEIPLPLTHQRIAEFVGSVRETVTLALQRLEKEGILEDSRGRIKVLDVQKLKSYTFPVS
ncbi:Crp/Fnr family transcriptional regulator [Candidatus Daviesbacteria bacterium]|nr:Crp/Fnr family transcriptional regulator [Candidatus Daviesbacteria bacterium]